MEIVCKSFKELSNHQLYQILKLRVDVFVVEQDCPYPELDNLDYQAAHIFKEDRKSESILGYTRVYSKNNDCAAIGRVVVAKSARGTELSKKLMKHSIEYATINLTPKKIVLSAQNAITDFYDSFGFKVCSSIYLEDGIPHVVMELPIK